MAKSNDAVAAAYVKIMFLPEPYFADDVQGVARRVKGSRKFVTEQRRASVQKRTVGDLGLTPMTWQFSRSKFGVEAWI